MVFEAFEDVAEHLPASSRRSTTIAGFIRHSAIYARNSLRTNTSGSLANPQPDLCPPSGAHSNLATDFSAFVTIRLKRAAAARRRARWLNDVRYVRFPRFKCATLLVEAIVSIIMCGMHTGFGRAREPRGGLRGARRAPRGPSPACGENHAGLGRSDFSLSVAREAGNPKMILRRPWDNERRACSWRAALKRVSTRSGRPGRRPGRVDAELENHRRRRRTFNGYVEARFDQHGPLLEEP